MDKEDITGNDEDKTEEKSKRNSAEDVVADEVSKSLTSTINDKKK